MKVSPLRLESAQRERLCATAMTRREGSSLGDPTVLPVGQAHLRARLQGAARRRFPLLRAEETTVLRLVHEAGDGLPGVAVDLYGSYAVLWLRTSAAVERQADLMAALTDLGVAGVYVKRPSRQARTLGTTRRDDVAPPLPAWGSAAPDPAWVEENGLLLHCRLGDGLATGIYPDQRDNRRFVRAHATGRRVLNLFAYTGSFSLAAAAGGAATTMTVDVSRPALAIAAENFRCNALTGSAHRFVAEDALVALRRAAVRGDRFDMIVLDPPSFATTKTSRFAADRDYGLLAAAAFGVLAPGGGLLACTNHRGVSVRRFHQTLRTAAREAGRTLRGLDVLPSALDFPVAPGDEPTMKAAWAVAGTTT